MMIATNQRAATNSAIATLVLSLVGLWVNTQLRIWRHVPRARPRAFPFTDRLRGLEGPNLSLAAMIFRGRELPTLPGNPLLVSIRAPVPSVLHLRMSANGWAFSHVL